MSARTQTQTVNDLMANPSFIPNALAFEESNLPPEPDNIPPLGPGPSPGDACESADYISDPFLDEEVNDALERDDSKMIWAMTATLATMDEEDYQVHRAAIKARFGDRLSVTALDKAISGKRKASKPGRSPEFARQVNHAVEWAASDRRARFDENLGLVPSLANAIVGGHHFAQAPGKELFVYIDGVYKQGAQEIINTFVRDTLEDWDKLKSWNAELGSNVAEYIRVSHTPALWDHPDNHPELLDLLVLKNGVLNLKTKEFGPHSHEYLTPVQIPVDWDASATCPAWERFISQTLPADCQNLVWEIAAWLITPDVSQQKAVLLVGNGGNGKSVFIDGFTKLIGRENVASKTLHQLEEDKFATADLLGKLANICADLPSQHLKSSSMFKAIVGGDSIDAQRKHKPAFSFRPYARLMFSANAYPKSSDATDGFYRRWKILPFSKSFDGSAERRSKREIDAELQAPAEMSGLLRYALSKLIGLRKRGFSESATAVEALDEFREVTDPLTGWLNRRTQRGEGAIDCKELLFAFNEEVSRPNGLAFMTSNQLTKLLGTRGIEKKRSHEYEYRGITWRPKHGE